MGKMAIFGGTFDPVHWGHLLMAQTALSQFALDRVIWMPDGISPHKSRWVLGRWEQRREMVRRAIANHPNFLLSPPLENNGISYAIETFLSLQHLYPDTQWYWIIGSDAFQTLPKWHRCQEIGKLCEWLVAPRLVLGADTQGDRPTTCFDPSPVVAQMNALGVQIRCSLLEMPSIGISSSLIRRFCLEGRELRYLVPETVRTYITAQKLYQSPPNP
ncbi:nicotinate (nicotinamide) nucleotide adenylyltransferase [Oscillatoriales cyanobacterium USR001]|nr:nicotinate (nicotinamide) nucleotide adenylyltransferase [Oscillatoriales cyanobacterium USR001]